MSHLKAALNRADKRIAEATGEKYGSFLEILQLLIPIFMPFLEKLPCLAPKPAPPDPNPTPTPEETKAWNDAWILKSEAREAFDEEENDYKRHTLNVMAKRIMREKRRNKDPIKKPEALELSRVALDEAREQELPAMRELIIEAQAGNL